jgi:hypothetical protein
MGLIWMIFGPLIILGVVRVMDWFGDDTSPSSKSSDHSTTRVNGSDGRSQHDGTAPDSPSGPTPSSSSPSTRGSSPERIWDVAGDPDIDDAYTSAWDASDYDDGGWDDGGWDDGGWDGGGDPSI